MEDLPLGKSRLADCTRNDQPRRVDTVFRDCARRYRDRPALTAQERSLTYGELDDVSDQVALTLRREGVRTGEYVAFSVLHREDAVIAMLGILKAGCAYVPIEALEDESKASELLRIAQVRGLMRARGRNDFRFSHVSRPEGCRLELEPHAARIAGNVGDGDAVACLMFTSGTTAGRKAVMVPHRGILRLVDRPHYIELTPDIVMLQLAPVTFDASAFEIWGTLLTGGRLVLYPDRTVDPRLLERVIESERVNTVWLTSGLFHALASNRAGLFAPLRTLLTGGDVVRPERVRQVFELFPHIRIVNGYGPTENSTFTCCHAMSSDEDIGDSIPIGTPITGTSVYVLDSEMVPVPDGDEGELYCSGLGVACGYLGAPQLTAERFIAAPWDRNEILYRTGDWVRARSDGALVFLGRRDDQVKVRGHRIQLGEIQQAIRSIDLVEEAVVDFVRNETGNRLVAHVQMNAAGEQTSVEIKAALREVLPPYAVPDVIRITSALELTQSGKLKRNIAYEPMAD